MVISVAVANDCQLVVDGVATMLAPFADRVRVVELDCRTPVATRVDVALYDAFAVDTDPASLRPHLENPQIGALVVYTWHGDGADVARLLDLGVRAVIDKRLDAAGLVAAIEAAHAGLTLSSPGRGTDTPELSGETANPVRHHDLSAREAEVVALIALGLPNDDIAVRLHISPNTVKSYIRSAYRKMGVHSRAQAVGWALDHGLRPATRRTVVPA